MELGVMNSKGEVVNVPVDLNAILARCGSKPMYYESMQIVDQEAETNLNPELIAEMYRARAGNALADSLKAMFLYKEADFSAGRRMSTASVVAMRPEDFHTLLFEVYLAGLQDGAAL